jgi:hypothetical protein
MVNRPRADCILCTDAAKHNEFISLLDKKIRGQKAADILGIGYTQMTKHARHAGAMHVMIPLHENAGDLQQLDTPVENLRLLQQEITRVISALRRGSDTRLAISAISEARNLAAELADLELKYSAAQGTRNSAFSKGDGQEILTACAGLCESCREKFIAAIPCDEINETY